MKNNFDEQIHKHKVAIEYHKEQIEKIKMRQERSKFMDKKGLTFCSSSDYREIKNKQSLVFNELSSKNYKAINVGGKKFYVTSDGDIYSDTRKYKGARHTNGYVYIQLNCMGDYLHKIVWSAFMGEIPEGMEVDHINTIRDDNRLENLRLVSSKQNKNNPLTIEHYKESNSRDKMKGFVKKN